jgi:hypothetical protein
VRTVASQDMIKKNWFELKKKEAQNSSDSNLPVTLTGDITSHEMSFHGNFKG